MPRRETKQQPTVTVHIDQGAASPAMRRAWNILWRHLIAAAKSEAKRG